MRTILPERASGAATISPEPGALPPLPAASRRAEEAEVRAKRDSAAILPRVTWNANLRGFGMGEETLDPGCHTLTLFGVDARAKAGAARRRLDLDAEMREIGMGRAIARDRSDAPDAQLSACVGRPTTVEVGFAGSPPHAQVLVAHAAWPLPDHLPTAWGSEVRGHMAHVLWTWHIRSLSRAPVMLAQGGAGVTPIPMSIEPGACYLALVSVAEGAARSVALRVDIGPREAFDDRGTEDEGAAVAFCAEGSSHGAARVEARGTPLLVWGLALYRLDAGIWEIPR
ncbi:MAG: hypothetical protein ACREJ3_07405, partial [Polyangiaceae bacterium]